MVQRNSLTAMAAQLKRDDTWGELNESTESRPSQRPLYDIIERRRDLPDLHFDGEKLHFVR